jgi:hypothetical protein
MTHLAAQGPLLFWYVRHKDSEEVVAGFQYSAEANLFLSACQSATPQFSYEVVNRRQLANFNDQA